MAQTERGGRTEWVLAKVECRSSGAFTDAGVRDEPLVAGFQRWPCTLMDIRSKRAVKTAISATFRHPGAIPTCRGSISKSFYAKHMGPVMGVPGHQDPSWV